MNFEYSGNVLFQRNQ